MCERYNKQKQFIKCHRQRGSLTTWRNCAIEQDLRKQFTLMKIRPSVAASARLPPKYIKTGYGWTQRN